MFQKLTDKVRIGSGGFFRIGRAFLPLLFCSGTTFASILTVPGPQYSSISAAISDAIFGDIVSVLPGTYTETINITTDGIMVIGSGPDLSIISGEGCRVRSRRFGRWDSAGCGWRGDVCGCESTCASGHRSSQKSGAARQTCRKRPRRFHRSSRLRFGERLAK